MLANLENSCQFEKIKRNGKEKHFPFCMTFIYLLPIIVLLIIIHHLLICLCQFPIHIELYIWNMIPMFYVI